MLVDLFDDYFRHGLSLNSDQTKTDTDPNSPVKFSITKPVFKYNEITS
jgi:hypothetical protein